MAKEAIQQKIKIVPNQTRIFGKIQTVSFLAKPENLSYSSFVILPEVFLDQELFS